jgi:hypothetical protein
MTNGHKWPPLGREFNRPFRALEHTSAAGDASITVVEDSFARRQVWGPAADGTDLVTLPDAGAFVRVKADLQAPGGAEVSYFLY